MRLLIAIGMLFLSATWAYPMNLNFEATWNETIDDVAYYSVYLCYAPIGDDITCAGTLYRQDGIRPPIMITIPVQTLNGMIYARVLAVDARGNKSPLSKEFKQIFNSGARVTSHVKFQ